MYGMHKTTVYIPEDLKRARGLAERADEALREFGKS